METPIRIIVSYIWNLILLFPLSIAAQMTSGSLAATQTLTLQQCIEVALQNSRRLGIAKARIEQAEFKYKETRSYNFPVLRTQFLYTHLSRITPTTISFPIPINGQSEFALNPNIQNFFQYQLAVQQPIFNGLRTRRDYLANRFLHQASQKDLLKEQLEVEYNVKNYYWNLYRVRKQKEILEENLAQVNAHLKDVENFLQQGLATQNDLLKVKLQSSNVRLALISVENSIQTVNAALCNEMGYPLTTTIVPASTPEVDEYELALPEMSRLTDNALFNRPDLRTLKLQYKAAEVQYRLGWSEFAPFLNFQGKLDYNNPNQRIFPLEQKFNLTWDWTFALTYELWSWGKRFHLLRQAKSVMRQTQGYIGMLEDGIKLEVKQNYLDIQRAREQITLARETVLQAEENFRVGQDKFKQGLLLNSELLDAEVLLLESRNNLLAAQVDYQLSRARLNKAVGQ